jgi:hypothetical protein
MPAADPVALFAPHNTDPVVGEQVIVELPLTDDTAPPPPVEFFQQPTPAQFVRTEPSGPPSALTSFGGTYC